jgi:alkylhydroperoxidase family enzyme
MGRIRGKESNEVGLRTRILYWLVKRKLGRVPEPVKVRAHNPKLLKAVGRMELFEGSSGAIPPDLKQLARLKAAALIGCPF